ncbi:MAG: ATP-binding cassette, subfamily F, member 3 [Halanaerobium sp. 4-GBenrich]|jgi:ATP-binding cassette subfamily F protein 3|uniref:ATP-binding cassette subfamily F protein 3 n=1 Tax=Halanaerobium congolense TaxID=54121 RepID=A0A1G6N1M4_9FIRM|nr:ABC-F family ATP-binding cassette domain-containing protein [Halanaerobium congolense]KXS50164.1 MAG: ATP-binding cassette, subfamily F, member 3 [Halanaerobium sp. T82-1]ODS51013.1 MAG: ATP-binding cassette, subfamily F, member 3 [Halanaerobium sp. 4-GBenrich]OEG62770.1 MAG: ABC transporter [Halanaerobium sp. MDAL1]PXV67595.1 ATP-binding cassette subfamily F protein 3 [Halanaerobium congolense]TDP26664.1 ATP-binding cassette subfamily F protein 3 [Halanaerobium congolense]
MAILNINNLKKEYGIETVLKDFSLNVNEGESVALIGPNGSGKTTIFQIITGREHYSDGTVSVRNDIEVGYLDQLPDFKSELSIYQELEKVFAEVKQQIKKMKKLEEKITHHGERVDKSASHSDNLEATMREYSALQREFEKGVGYEYQSKIRQVAAGMGFDEEEIHEKTLDQLSGGEKTRVGLAKLLLIEPDLLLLDEPTNHLDLKSVEWLENYLNSYQGSLLIISHDRYFLDNTIERIVEIKNGKNEDYSGNYSYYQKERKRRYEQRLREYKNQQKKIKQLEDAIEQLYIWGRSRDSEKMFKRAKAMEKRLEKIDRLEKPQLKGRKMKLELETEIRGGDDVLFVENLSKRFEDLNLFQDLNFELHRTDKAAIIGDNGTGKSTILRIIMGEIPADRGQVRIGTNVYPAYYRQEFEGFNPEDDLITALQRETAVTNSKARDMLASFLFTGEDVFKKVKQLSGGEKSRLRLLQLMSGNYNFLILDEPTNHLDLASREVLEEALKDYSGTVLIVSHDRYFLDKVIDYIYELENQELNKYFGDYSYYKQKKKNEISEQQDLDEQEDKSEGKLDYEAQKEARSREQKRQKRLEEIEVEIEALEKNLSDLESQMTAEENINDFELLQELKDKYEQQNSRLETLYQEWEKIV